MNQVRKSNATFINEEFTLQSQTSFAVDETEIGNQIEHIESFIKVLKARQQFFKTLYRKNDPSTCPAQDLDVDITQNTNDYNKNVLALWTKIEAKQLQTCIVNKAVDSAVLQKLLHYDAPEIGEKSQRIIDLCIQVAVIVEEENKIKLDLLKAKRELINKQYSSILSIQKVLDVLEPKKEQQQREREGFNIITKKLKKMNIVQDIINCFLRETDEQLLFSDPKLLEILKQNQEPSIFKLQDYY